MMPEGGKVKWNVTEGKKKKKSEFTRGTYSKVSCSGVTITGLPNSHKHGNVAFVNRQCLQNSIARGSFQF